MANGGDITDASEMPLTFAMETVKPVSPCSVAAYRNPTDATPDVDLTWLRRTRALFNIFAAAAEAPLVEASEEYEVDLMNPAGTIAPTYHPGHGSV